MYSPFKLNAVVHKCAIQEKEKKQNHNLFFKYPCARQGIKAEINSSKCGMNQMESAG